MTSSTYQLRMQKGPEPFRVFPLTSASVTIGRDPMSDIVISDPEVSRQHARLSRTLSGYRVQDLGSTNGTFIDGARLAGDPVELLPGQVVTMGSGVALLYEVTRDESAAENEQLETVIDSGPIAFGAPEAEPEAEEAEPVIYESESEEPPLPTPAVPEFPEEAYAETPQEEATPAFIWPEQEETEEGETEEEGEPGTSLEPAPLAYESPSAEPQWYEPGAANYEPSATESEAVRDAEPYVASSTGGRVVTEEGGTVSPGGTSSRRLAIIVAAMAFLLLCCCCAIFAFAYYYGGDWLLRQVGTLP